MKLKLKKLIKINRMFYKIKIIQKIKLLIRTNKLKKKFIL